MTILRPLLQIFPGGSCLTSRWHAGLVQTRKFERPIQILLYGSSFWKEVIDFDALARHGMIGREDLNLFHYVDDPLQALGTLQAGLGTVSSEEVPDFAASRCSSQ